MEEVGNNRRPIPIGLLLFVCLLLFIFPGCKQELNKTNLSDYTGVWAGKNSELVQTGKYTLLFNRQGLQIKAILRKVVKRQDTLYSNFVSGYIFDAIDKSYKPVEGKNIRQSLLFKNFLKPKDEALEVSMDSQRLSLEKIEQIKACKPYDMPKAQKGSIGKCLQHWQLGTTEHKVTSHHLHITIGTNRHLYIFQSNENMLYCRAARIRHNEKGPVFLKTSA